VQVELMNHLIADNKVSTLRAYLSGKLEGIYDARESASLVQMMFEEFHSWTRTELILNAEQRLGESELLRYHFALKRLLHGEPIQYVLGFGHFLDMKLHTTPAALIPRPETEELVRLIAATNTLPNPTILDIGTGTGCIAIALKKLLPGAHVQALDVSKEALELARTNAEEQEALIGFIQLDIIEQVPEGTFDIVVSNPPYIPKGEEHTMSERVTKFEPHVALFTNDSDPWVFYRRLMYLTPSLLTPGGTVFCEIHENSAPDLLQLAHDYSITTPVIHTDMQGKNRMMTWQNKPA
jgi:release factor glutamine methyltransferase